MKLNKIDEKIKKIQSRQAEIIRQLAPLNKESEKLTNKLRKYIEKKDKLYADEHENDWQWLLESSYLESHFHAKLRLDKLQELGLYSSGHETETNQAFLQISMYRPGCMSNTAAKQRTLDGLKAILPHKKPIKGVIRIGILGAETVKLCIDDKYYLTAGYRSQMTEQFTDLEDALDYIFEQYYGKDQ